MQFAPQGGAFCRNAKQPPYSNVYHVAVAGVLANLSGMTKPARGKAIVKQVALSRRLPPHKQARFDNVANCSENGVEIGNISEILSFIWMPRSRTDAEREALLAKALDLFESFEPSDRIEAMPAMPMVGTQNAILACLRRAMFYEQS